MVISFSRSFKYLKVGQNTLECYSRMIEGKATNCKRNRRTPVLTSEVKESLCLNKQNKATGLDKIATEMITSLGDFGIKKITCVLNYIHDTGIIPEDLSKSVFFTVPKKPGTIDCECHQRVTLMSHITIVLLRILMKRARHHIRPEIGMEECCFMRDKGTRNAIQSLELTQNEQ